VDLLTANSEYTDGLLNEERYQLGGASIGELYMLVYAQALASHPLTWQVSVLNPKQNNAAFSILFVVFF
jgi:hypothetical protein